MKKTKRPLASLLALMLLVGSMGIASAEEVSADRKTEEALSISKEELSKTSGGLSKDDEYWPIEEQLAAALELDSMTGDRLVEFLEKLLMTLPIQAEKINENVVAIQSSQKTETASKNARSDTTESVPTLEAQIADILVGTRLTPNQKELVLDTLSLANNTMSVNAAAAVNICQCVLNVTYYKQDTSSYCAPATTKQTLQYINGSSFSQSTYASHVGSGSGSDYSGSGRKLINYVNSQQSRNHYLYYKQDNPGSNNDNSSNMTIYQMQGNINYALTHSSPAILNIWKPVKNTWGYTVPNGHFLNISGQYTNGTYQMTDPYYGYSRGPASSKYTKSRQVLWDDAFNCIGW